MQFIAVQFIDLYDDQDCIVLSVLIERGLLYFGDFFILFLSPAFQHQKYLK